MKFNKFVENILAESNKDLYNEGMKNKEEKHVTITSSEYEELKARALMLSCLEEAGVDSWRGYDYAMQEFQGKITHPPKAYRIRL